MVVYLPGGEHAHVCPQCAPRCIADPERAQLVGRAALSGQTLEDVERVFAKLGAPVPTTPAECDIALGLPAGSTEAAMPSLHNSLPAPKASATRRCPTCDGDLPPVVDRAHSVQIPGAPRGVFVVLCADCHTRWNQSAGFRRDRGALLAAESHAQWIAQISVMLDRRPDQWAGHGTPEAADAACGLPAGSVEAAMRAALGMAS